MRRAISAFMPIALMAALAMSQHAWAQTSSDDSRRSMGNLGPSSDNRRTIGNLRPDSATGGAPAQGSSQSAGNPTVVIPSPYYYGYGGPTYYHGYRPRYCGDYPYYGYGYRYPYRRYYAYPPPVYLPSQQLYGPGAMRRFMGMW
jgi:hypothetical protein